MSGETPSTKTAVPIIKTGKTQKASQIQTQVNIDNLKQASVEPQQSGNEPDAITGNGMYFSFKINKNNPSAEMERQIRDAIFKKIKRGEI